MLKENGQIEYNFQERPSALLSDCTVKSETSDSLSMENFELPVEHDHVEDPFFCEANMAHLRRGIKALNARQGTEHEPIEDHTNQEE